MGYLVAMVIRVVIFIGAILYMIYSTGKIIYDVMRHRYFDKEHFETNQKSLRLPVQKLWLT